VKALLDTHTFLWAVNNDARLSIEIQELLENPEHELLLSLASLWEISIKLKLGKLLLPVPFDVLARDKVLDFGLKLLPIEIRHFSLISSLELLHRDPFDRLLVAQAIVEGIPIISLDPMMRLYPVRVLPEGE
jgi:PIN domain nuclease of toxin-antitoxin system